MSFENGLFIFRRDYRMVDNIGLLSINSKCKNVYTIFIFTPEQVSKSNEYKSTNAVQFMIESLDNLSQEIKKNGGKLYCFYGDNERIVADCIKAFNIECVCYNADYTPYAITRDDNLHKLCDKLNIHCYFEHDYYLHIPGSIINSSGKPYQKFTPYYESALKKKVDVPVKARKIKFQTKNTSISNAISLTEAFSRFTKKNDEILVHGGRVEAIKALKQTLKTQTHYSKTHNDLDKQTTQLSAYIKFGCVSIREVYAVYKGNRDLIRQLIWRDFYANVLYSFPQVLSHSMKPAYSKIKWHKNANWFNAWTNGTTGFPVVDACMRQLNTTGYMHNRGRLIVASFLVKTLLINWKEGEKYFATKLVDYDPASNNGNWQWISSSGVDSQPYFRIFNPWSQSENFDPDAIYIKKWVPELADVPAKDIHQWFDSWKDYKDSVKYYKPICEYEIQKERALKMYRDIY